MSKITLEILKKSDVSDRFEKYFVKLEKTEWDIVELMERCRKDGEEVFAKILYKCVDNQEEFERVIDYSFEIANNYLFEHKIYTYREGVAYKKYTFDINYAFEYNSRFFENNLELFKKAIEYYIKLSRSLDYAFDYCGALCEQLFEKNPELLYKVACSQIINNFSVYYLLEYHGKFFENNLVLFQKAVELLMNTKNQSLVIPLLCCQEAFKKLPEFYEVAQKYQEKIDRMFRRKTKRRR